MQGAADKQGYAAPMGQTSSRHGHRDESVTPCDSVRWHFHGDSDTHLPTHLTSKPN